VPTEKRLRHRERRALKAQDDQQLTWRDRLRSVRLSTWIFFGVITAGYVYVVFGGTFNGRGVGPVNRALILLWWPIGVAVGVGSTLWSTHRRSRS
jgi:hypothetical protein